MGSLRCMDRSHAFSFFIKNNIFSIINYLYWNEWLYVLRSNLFWLIMTIILILVIFFYCIMTDFQRSFDLSFPLPVNAMLWVRFLLEELKYFNFLALIDKVRWCRKAHHAVSRKLQGKWWTKCINTRFPLSCYTRDTAWSYKKNLWKSVLFS